MRIEKDPTRKGVQSPAAKRAHALAPKIRALRAKGMLIRSIARELGIYATMVHNHCGSTSRATAGAQHHEDHGSPAWIRRMSGVSGALPPFRPIAAAVLAEARYAR